MSKFASRIVFLVMLATFFSPDLGWQMIASHDQLAHASFSAHGSGPDQDHDSHDDAHSAIGHVFTHMPMSIAIVSRPVLPAGRELEPLPPKSSFRNTPREAPFKPPRLTSLV